MVLKKDNLENYPLYVSRVQVKYQAEIIDQYVVLITIFSNTYSAFQFKNVNDEMMLRQNRKMDRKKVTHCSKQSLFLDAVFKTQDLSSLIEFPGSNRIDIYIVTEKRQFYFFLPLSQEKTRGGSFQLCRRFMQCYFFRPKWHENTKKA